MYIYMVKGKDHIVQSENIYMAKVDQLKALSYNGRRLEYFIRTRVK